MANLSLDNVTKRFGGFTAVRNVSLSVEPHEVFCLLGPSGCGKTTTLRMIAGLEAATEGRITFGDIDVTERPAESRNIAMAFQFYALYPDLTVANNLVFPLDAEKSSMAEKDARLNHIAEVLQLGDVLGRYPHQLSEGEKQRVAVGRCIIRKPNAFLFDEPLSRLDVKLREEMRGSIRKILSALDRPTVIVTHDQLEAMTMGDRIAVMHDGMIEQMGRPADVFDRPANTFIAGFIGTPQMTLLKGECRAWDGHRLTVSFGNLAFDMYIPDLTDPPVVGRPVTIGFRPRAARLSVPAADVEFKDATLTLIENMGAEWLLHFDWRGQTMRVLQTGPVKLREGDTISVTLSIEDLTIFGGDDRRIARTGELK